MVDGPIAAASNLGPGPADRFAEIFIHPRLDVDAAWLVVNIKQNEMQGPGADDFLSALCPAPAHRLHPRMQGSTARRGPGARDMRAVH